MNPAASSRRVVSSGEANVHGPSQPSPTSASTAWTAAMLPCPPHCATSRPPGRRTEARCRNSASWSATQWKVAVDRIASTLASPSGRGAARSAVT